jgi:lactobin A/cerein 7B family class IIb bacteriocin
MNKINYQNNLTELSNYELLSTHGGAVPLIALAWAFAKGFGAGAGAAGTVHLAIQAVEKATS